MDILEAFPIILYTLGAMLLVILIIIGIKLIHTIDKTNEILDDAYNKTKSLNGLFSVIDQVTDTLSTVSDSIVGKVTAVIGKIFYKDKKKENDKDE